MTFDADLALAHRLADLADPIALTHFTEARPALRIKGDGSPVGAADHDIESALRALIARERPEDAFLGEELGARGSSSRRWIVDPVDGTASFLAGEPEWATLIALEHLADVALGLVSAPALGRRWWAAPHSGSWTAPWPSPPGTDAQRLATTGTSRLQDAVIAIWPPPHRLTEPERAVAARVADACASTRPTLDWDATVDATSTAAAAQTPKPSTGSGVCHGALLVATAQVDAFLLLGAGRWDVAALVPIVEEAGGAYTDLPAVQREGRETAVFSNAALHEQLVHVARTAPEIGPR